LGVYLPEVTNGEIANGEKFYSGRGKLPQVELLRRALGEMMARLHIMKEAPLPGEKKQCRPKVRRLRSYRYE